VTRGRLEAFSDGVIAIIITIMVLELKVPHGADLAALEPLLPKISGYVLSFVMLGIYWNNHHHLMHATKHVNGRVLWANLHLLFWLSLMPFVTAWAGETHFAAWPVAAWGAVQFMCGTAYFILVRSLLSLHGGDSELAAAIGRDFKGIASLALYLIAVLLALMNPVVALSIYILVAVMWLVPDRRIERRLGR
jgi:TMEM175 potassium channel family protein